MKTFYGGTYIGKEILAQNHIYYPIRLEYYKIEKQENLGVFYGIEVVKTEYKTEKPEVEKDVVEHVTMEESEIVELLEKFKQGTVMPGLLKETLEGQCKNNELVLDC
ncbi:MAG: hypothetical protein HFJ27_00555 [Clostridia bacterium]|nr:hypothetical protein [Clostridia bacterium]